MKKTIYYCIINSFKPLQKMGLQTKEQRTNLLKSIIERKTSNGYTLEVYKGLQILTKSDGDKFYLECYKDTSTNAILNFYYKVEAQMLDRIEKTKQSYDSSQEYKAKRKSEQNGRLTSAASCADAIRSELKTVFPYIKFSVRSENFAGGDAVRISWEDGATVKEVEEIAGKYQYGNFNGMEDIYEYSNNLEGLPQAKYITESRKMSEATGQILKPIAERLYSGMSADAYGCRDFEQFLYRIFCGCSFPPNAKPVDIIRTPETCGINDAAIFYTISFDAQTIDEPVNIAPVPFESGKIDVISYSEKAIAVIGDTKPIKDKLKALGGKFNFRLSCGAGWIFPKSKLEKIKNALTSQPISPEVGEIKEDVQVKIYNNIEDITEAANSGKVISLCNLSEIVNKPKHVTSF